jgi:putative redox protein
MSDASPKPVENRPPNVIRAVWAGEHRFDTLRGDGRGALRLDGSAETGPTPPDALLSSVAACSGIDVVDILAKRRTPIASLAIEISAVRRNEQPRRFEKMTVTYEIIGAGIERVHAERAVQLAFDKYCSVAATLAVDHHYGFHLDIGSERGAPVGQVIYSPG